MTNALFAAYEAKCEAAAKLEAEILPSNKRVLFEALAVVGIVLVALGFEGSGDSGQLEQPAGFDAQNREVAVPGTPITVQTVDFDRGIVEERATTVPEFIEDLAFHLLGEAHPGWEDGDGACGEFRFARESDTITLQFHERYVETKYYEHEF